MARKHGGAHRRQVDQWFEEFEKSIENKPEEVKTKVKTNRSAERGARVPRTRSKLLLFIVVLLALILPLVFRISPGEISGSRTDHKLLLRKNVSSQEIVAPLKPDAPRNDLSNLADSKPTQNDSGKDPVDDTVQSDTGEMDDGDTSKDDHENITDSGDPEETGGDTATTGTDAAYPFDNNLLFPVLWFNYDDISDLRTAAKGSHAHIAKRIQDFRGGVKSLPPEDPTLFSNHWNEKYGNEIAILAFYCLIFPEDQETTRFTTEYLRIMVSQPSWIVAGSPTDEVPVSHSLTGVALALDFLWPGLSAELRNETIVKINKELHLMMDAATTKWWGYSYLQNHVWSNWVSIFIAGLVQGQYQVQDPASSDAAKEAHAYLLSNMNVLDRIKDGSMDEGVGYTSYSTRGVSHFVSLAVRHFEYNATSSGMQWLEKHFQFMLYTLFDRFSRTSGYADANFAWYYGPVSQLHFLDKYVLRSGCGNWLGEQITKNEHLHREVGLANSKTLHTEYIWYDAKLPSNHCPLARRIQDVDKLHVFSDWGVATYGAGSDIGHQTFLSLKASHLHGRAVSDIVKNERKDLFVKPIPERLNKKTLWGHFNPGHDHPDQGSFEFYPRGVPVITEDLYNAKYTSNQNTLLFRGGIESSSDIACDFPFVGQQGSCKKWLIPPKASWGNLTAEIIATDENSESGMVLMAAEFSNWYPSGAKIASLSRILILLNSDLLVVVDHIGRKANSPITHSTAMFHNFHTGFNETVTSSSRSGLVAGLDVPGYDVFVASSGGVNLVSTGTHAGGRYGPVHFLNVTNSLLGKESCNRSSCQDWAAYVFGPKSSVRNLKALELGKNDGDIFSLQVDVQSNTSKVMHNISVVSPSMRLVERTKLLGKSCLVSVQKSGGGDAVCLGKPSVQRKCTPDLTLASSEPQRVRCRQGVGADLLLQESFTGQKLTLRQSPVLSQKGASPFLYCGIPGCGVSKWRRLIRLVEGVDEYKDMNAHNPAKSGLRYLWELPVIRIGEIVDDPQVLSFIIVRNPFVRTLSAWLDQMLRLKDGKRSILFDGIHNVSDDFTTFARNLQETPLPDLNEHWLPMSTFCGAANGMQFDRVLKIEAMQDWGDSFLKEVGIYEFSREGWKESFFPFNGDVNAYHRQILEKLKAYYTAEAVNIIRDVYRSDFELFGYNMSSPLEW